MLIRSEPEEPNLREELAMQINWKELAMRTTWKVLGVLVRRPRSSIHMWLGEDVGTIRFTGPISKEDLKSGKCVPANIRSERHKNQLFTDIVLRKETLLALRALLNELLGEEE
jgi:hypothetical protein